MCGDEQYSSWSRWEVGTRSLYHMKIPAPKGHIASVFFDTGATINFISENFAKLCGFKGQSRTLSVSTLGNVTTEYLTVTEYDCLLRDELGEIMSFKAYGLERVTGQVTQMPVNQLQKLFPGVPLATLKQMLRAAEKDTLVNNMAEKIKKMDERIVQLEYDNEDNPNTEQNLPHFVLPDVHGNLLVKMKNRTPRGLFLKFNSLQELHAIVNKHHTTDANKAFNEMMKKDEGVPNPDANAKIPKWPFGRLVFAGDIRKFHNQVHLVEEDVHMQRIMWRNMDTTRDPDYLAVVVNTFDVTSANCIATCALMKSADEFAEKYRVESEEVKTQSYVDDQLGVGFDKADAVQKTEHWDEICDYASMGNKGWTFSGDKSPDILINGGADNVEKRLDQSWDSATDVFTFSATLRVKLRKGGTEEVNISTVGEFVEHRVAMMTRRMLLSNVQSIFDPMGLLTPVLTQAKILLRETW